MIGIDPPQIGNVIFVGAFWRRLTVTVYQCRHLDGSLVNGGQWPRPKRADSPIVGQ